jgi:5-methyltetrahydrofolate--homocysteine methyltransferase
MTIDFSAERWQRLKETYARWWAGDLERPIVGVELYGRDPGRPKPDVPLLTQENCTDFSYAPEQLIDRIDWELSTRVYLGDGFPFFNMDCFGPGVAAAFLGARLDNSSGRVWFYPPADLPIEQIHFAYDSENPWLKRVKAIYRAAVERWQGKVIIGMTDLGGNLDILSTFRPSEKLLLDLYDAPEQVLRLLDESHALWHRFFDEINAIITPTTPGYSDWGGIYSDQPGYMLQCDFSYMIGPKMFKKFALPELAATCKRLPYAFYHLDGVGEFPHLDFLLSIPELRGIQWIPGDGMPDPAHWPELYQRIHAGGKKIQVSYGGFNALQAVVSQIGTTRGVQMKTMGFSMAEEVAVRSELAKYGVRD